MGEGGERGWGVGGRGDQAQTVVAEEGGPPEREERGIFMAGAGGMVEGVALLRNARCQQAMLAFRVDLIWLVIVKGRRKCTESICRLVRSQNQDGSPPCKPFRMCCKVLRLPRLKGPRKSHGLCRRGGRRCSAPVKSEGSCYFALPVKSEVAGVDKHRLIS